MKLPVILLTVSSARAFVPSAPQHVLHAVGPQRHLITVSPTLCMNPVTTDANPDTHARSSQPSPEQEQELPPILIELRDVAMKLHTKEQAPREGQAPSAQEPAEPYVPTHDDYLAFLVDSQHVYYALDEVVHSTPELFSRFSNTGLERTDALEKDIEYMVKEYGLMRPDIGSVGMRYAEELRGMVVSQDGTTTGIPEFICHYYNFYFAHLAGGRMIGKQMSKLLLGGATLEFYKWEGDVNEKKAQVKDSIEELARTWTLEERSKCVEATADAFRCGGAINGYLYGSNPH